MACNCGGGDRCRRGRVTGQRAGTARWAAELAAGGLVPGVAADGAPAVQLAVRTAAAIATSRPLASCLQLLATVVSSGRGPGQQQGREDRAARSIFSNG